MVLGYLRILILVFLIFSSRPVMAETKTFVREYTHQAGDADSKISSRTIALEQVRQLLLGEIGTYLEANTEVINFQLTSQQIRSLTAGIVRTEILDEKWDGASFRLKARITVDADEVTRKIGELRKDEQKSERLEEVRAKVEQALREIERLKLELERAKPGAEYQEQINQYKEEVKTLSATYYFTKGYSFGESGNFSEAIEACGRAIGLKPDFAEAYNTRGDTYSNLGNHQQAVRDCDRAIELKPDFAEAYNNRGRAYNNLGNRQQAARDWKIAAGLGDKIAQDFLKSSGI